MRETLNVAPERLPIDLDANVTFAQVPDWLGRSTRDLKLSVMRPLGAAESLPCLVWFCGGGWMNCDHNVHLPNLVDVVRAGYVVASAEYRDSNKGDFPMPLEDAKAAIRYLRANAARWGIDAGHMAVAGESAGGHQALLAGFTGGVERFDVGANLDQSSAVQAVVDYYGVVNPLTAKRDNEGHAFDFVYRNLLGAEPEDAPELVAAANPETYVSAACPPTLILQGTADGVVPPADSVRLYEQLEAAGVDATLLEFEGAAHMDAAFWQPQTVERVIAFLDRTLKA
jgi:acetyl esterase/lipase